MAKLVTIFGGSGFVGRYIARRLADAGWRVRVASRRPDTAGFVRVYGDVGQVAPVACNIRDEASIAAALDGANAVVNCIGILAETGQNRFDAVQAEGAERIARLAVQMGVSQMVQISAIGADATSNSDYARTKAEGEAAVLRHMPNAVILRPSVIFGAEDEFFNRFAGMARISPVLPLVGAQTRFQPVYVDDVARAAVLAVQGAAAPGVYELGGPDVATFRDWMQQMLAVIRRRRLILGLPFWVATLMAGVFGVSQKLTLGLLPSPVTADQVKNLRRDNVAGDAVRGFADLNITPTPASVVLPEYLWRFRPKGQYSDLVKGE